MENKVMIKSLGKWTLVCGILSVLFYFLHDVIGAQYYPGYEWMKQAVSDLTAADAPSFVVASGFTTVYKIFSCVCSAFLCVMVRDEHKIFRIGVYLFSLMNGISAAGYALFPLTSGGYDGSKQSFIHVYVITVLVVLTMLLITTRLNYSVKGVVEDLDYQARNDLMTNLLNKSTYRKLVENDLSSYNGKQAIAFLMFDLDNFKEVNDAAGHKFGDEVIKNMAELLRDVFEDEGALIGRVGGDEFSVYKSYNDISRDDAEKRIHDLTMKLYEQFNVKFKEENEKYGLTVSSGILVTGAGEYKFDDLYQKTDVALYISKRNGKSKPTFI